MAVLRVQGPCQNIEKTRKLLKQKQSHGTYHIAADGITGAWSHEQFANRVKKRKKESHSPALQLH